MKSRTVYVCQECGYHSLKWLGRCPSCGAWGAFLEEVERQDTKDTTRHPTVLPVVLLSVAEEGIKRLVTGISELDRVLGGGIVPGSVVLVGGDPGVGKSTLMLQLCLSFCPYRPLYVSGEESLQQLRHRASRLGIQCTQMSALAEQSLEIILAAIEESKPGLVVVDSIQTLFSEEIDSLPGSLNQLRYCTAQLVQVAKRSAIPMFLVGHVTKEGMLAGPKVLEHMVDVVIQFEGEGTYAYRILRAAKNRYGSTNEIGVFEMSQHGLVEVSNPSVLFLSSRHNAEPGTAITALLEGSRALLVETQALVLQSGYGVPQRVTTGFDYKRLQMLLAVLERRLGLDFVHRDVFLNMVGGFVVRDPAADLAVCMALVSSLHNRPVPSDVVLIGEVGLTGELRLVSSIETRLKEAEKLGFQRALVPPIGVQSSMLNVETAENLSDALSLLGL